VGLDVRRVTEKESFKEWEEGNTNLKKARWGVGEPLRQRKWGDERKGEDGI